MLSKMVCILMYFCSAYLHVSVVIMSLTSSVKKILKKSIGDLCDRLAVIPGVLVNAEEN